jgi:predicted Rossmann-fold nucleotide-binding protein
MRLLPTTTFQILKLLGKSASVSSILIPINGHIKRKIKMKYLEISNTEDLKRLLLSDTINIEFTAFQSIDFKSYETIVLKKNFKECIFLGCELTEKLKNELGKDNYLFPDLKVPYNIYQNRLYTKNDLYGGFVIGKPESYDKTFDKLVYDHFIKTGKEAESIFENLARRLHDHAITDALYDFLSNYEEKKVVAVMGGHGLARNTNDYKKIARLSKILTENGYLMTTGGGPGAMEAAHVGAWFAGKKNEELEEAFSILDNAPTYKHQLWIDTALRVIEKYPENDYESLGIPTWLYGHEPPTPFASKIAKYFANSVREDGLITVAKGGIIFSPGSAGTVQEIFQEVTQNHYLIFGYSSPMIFMNVEYWTNTIPVYTFLEEMSQKNIFKNLILFASDSIDDIKNQVERFK